MLKIENQFREYQTKQKTLKLLLNFRGIIYHKKTDLNVAPYYDDFKEDKNFHRILFRPGFAVQGSRELTQLQSILQNQIERFGNHVFQEGTLVIPGLMVYLLTKHMTQLNYLQIHLLGKQLMFHNTIMQQNL